MTDTCYTVVACTYGTWKSSWAVIGWRHFSSLLLHFIFIVVISQGVCPESRTEPRAAVFIPPSEGGGRREAGGGALKNDHDLRMNPF